MTYCGVYMPREKKMALAEWCVENITPGVMISLASLALTLVILVGGWVGNWAMMQTRIGGLDARLTKVEGEIVPRAEHDRVEKERDSRDHQLDERLQNIERMLQLVIQDRK